MTNHERTIEEREKALKLKPELLKKRRERRRVRQSPVTFLEGRKKPIDRPQVMLYYSWVTRTAKPIEGESKEDNARRSKYLGFELAAVPEVKEWTSRKDSHVS
jgi:hypothetical protein